MSQIRGSLVVTAVLLLAGAFVNAMVVATAPTPPTWGWARLITALALAAAAIQLVVRELRAVDA